MLSQIRIVIICLSICLLVALCWLAYNEWVRHFVDWMAGFYVNDTACSEGSSPACDRAIKIYSLAQLVGYGVFGVCIYLPVAFVTTKLFVQQSNIRLSEAIPAAAAVLAVPIFSSYFASTVSIGSAVFHYLVLLSGFCAACLWRRKYAT